MAKRSKAKAKARYGKAAKKAKKTKKTFRKAKKTRKVRELKSMVTTELRTWVGEAAS